MPLTLEQAERMLQSARAKAQEMGIPFSIGVVDSRGDPIAMVRMDGARWHTAGLCLGKAFASATWGRPSGEPEEWADHPVFRSLMMMQGGRILASKGALPVLQGKDILGAIGVAGSSGEHDEEVAQAGLDTLS